MSAEHAVSVLFTVALLLLLAVIAARLTEIEGLLRDGIFTRTVNVFVDRKGNGDGE